jgi:signal transduction histidine kinase
MFENNGLRIEVRDTGEGLPEMLRDNIFELLSAENTYMQGHLPGLGLSICKAVVERSNGRIGAESPPGQGTTIWHWVPVKRIN